VTFYNQGNKEDISVIADCLLSLSILKEETAGNNITGEHRQ